MGNWMSGQRCSMMHYMTAGYRCGRHNMNWRGCGKDAWPGRSNRYHRHHWSNRMDNRFMMRWVVGQSTEFKVERMSWIIQDWFRYSISWFWMRGNMMRSWMQ